MMMLDSGTVSPRASSRSTGNLPTGHSARNAVALFRVAEIDHASA